MLFDNFFILRSKRRNLSRIQKLIQILWNFAINFVIELGTKIPWYSILGTKRLIIQIPMWRNRCTMPFLVALGLKIRCSRDKSLFHYSSNSLSSRLRERTLDVIWRLCRDRPCPRTRISNRLHKGWPADEGTTSCWWSDEFVIPSLHFHLITYLIRCKKSDPQFFALWWTLFTRGTAKSTTTSKYCVKKIKQHTCVHHAVCIVYCSLWFSTS